jgi:PAS domain S-box-containing protein
VVVGIEGIARDITERKRAEQAIRESAERLHTLVTNAPVVLFAIDREGVFTVVEGRGLSGLGLRPGENVGRSVFDVYRDVPEVIDAARRALAGESFTATVELAERLVFEAHYAPLRDQHGQVSGGIGLATDVTDRHRAEEMLRTQRDLAIALSASTDIQDTLRLCLQAAIRVSDLDSGCVYLGDRSSGALYLASHEGLGDKFVERILRFEAGSDHVRTVMTGKPLYTRYEKLRVRMDEARRREGLRAFAAVPVQHGDEVIACLCVASHSLDDIPPASRAALEAIAARIGSAIARSEADEALRESEERFRRLSEATLEGIIIHDHGLILDANAQAAAIHGYELSEFIGMDVLTFIAPEWHDVVRQRTLSGYGEPYEVWGLRKDGTTFPMEICGKTTSYEGRQVRVGVGRDISERKRAEEAAQAAREELERRVEHAMRRGNPYGLTFRELTVLYLIAAGRADKEIAFQLGISPRTASKHVENILQKMGVASRTEASVHAVREDLAADAD